MFFHIFISSYNSKHQQSLQHIIQILQLENFFIADKHLQFEFLADSQCI